MWRRTLHTVRGAAAHTTISRPRARHIFLAAVNKIPPVLRAEEARAEPNSSRGRKPSKAAPFQPAEPGGNVPRRRGVEP